MQARSASTGREVGPFAWSNAGTVANEWLDGGWYTYIVCYEKLSSTTTRTRVWMARDGQTPVLRATVNGPAASGNVAPDVGRILIGRSFNQARKPSQNQALWLGSWDVVDGNTNANPFNAQ